MRKIIFSVFTLCCLSVTVSGQTRSNEITVIGRSLDSVKLSQKKFDKRLQQLSTASIKNKNDIQNLKTSNDTFDKRIDDLKTICDSLKKAQAVDRTTINGKIQETNNTLVSNQSIMENRTLWGGVIAAVILFISLGISYYLTKRIKQGKSSIDEVRKAQDVLQKAHEKMQEESVKLDNKMIELFEKQMAATPMAAVGTQIDHSLALKVADEIVRIEMNLSRMDTSVKGYKQLIKAVQRIKDNFNANGYEIVDMLGKPYVEGMKGTVTFVTDESLEHGQQIITRIIKPQINYQQQMIQAAQIEVSQSE